MWTIVAGIYAHWRNFRTGLFVTQAWQQTECNNSVAFLFDRSEMGAFRRQALVYVQSTHLQMQGCSVLRDVHFYGCDIHYCTYLGKDSQNKTFHQKHNFCTLVDKTITSHYEIMKVCIEGDATGNSIIQQITTVAELCLDATKVFA